MTDQPIWRVDLFGGLRVRHEHREMAPLDTRKTVALLACLAIRPDQNVPREVLAEQLWPGEMWEATRNRLRQALSVLRRALEPPGIVEGSVLAGERGTVRLCSAGVRTDLAAFDALLRRAARASEPDARAALLAEAAQVYEGDLLPGFYEDWIVAARERYAETYRNLLFDLAVAWKEAGETQKARETLVQALHENPLREDAHHLLIRLYAESGRPAEAICHFQEFERTLKTRLGVSPSADMVTLAAQLRQGSVPVIPPVRVPERAPLRPLPADESERPTGIDTVEPEGGAVPLGSPFYLTREADTVFATAIARQDSIVLVKGARQMGKTSLLARGLQRARTAGAQVVFTDLQKLDHTQMESPAHLFETFAEMLVDQLGLDTERAEYWNDERGWNVNFERFMRRHVLASVPHLVWGMDEIDRLFGYAYREVVFGLFRSWHNERSLNPDGPWSQLTLAIAYATEAHLFITDLNQSPFNVGTRLTLEDFTADEVAEVNARYGQPVPPEEMTLLLGLVGGHPYLVRRVLQALTSGKITLPRIRQRAIEEDGPFGDHLRQMLRSLTRDPLLCEAIREVLKGRSCPTSESFYRLRSAGILVGTTAAEARLRCGLYREFLEDRLR
ncbi:MAG: AAA-like domain-containing protein [Capsulimonadales bacterium]|nr:AAA-like domain-containing protein [Capsulimonadales bacterium]